MNYNELGELEGKIAEKKSTLYVGPGKNDELFDSLRTDDSLRTELDEIELDYEFLFEQIAENSFPKYEDMVPLLLGLGDLLDRNLSGLHGEEELFSSGYTSGEEDKALLLQLVHKQLSNQEIIEKLYMRVYTNIMAYKKEKEEESV